MSTETGSQGGLFVELDTRELERRFALLPRQLDIAIGRAAVRTRDWLSTQLRRRLAADAKLPQRALKTRFRRGRTDAGTAGAVLWIGLNPVLPTKAGPAMKTPTGAKAGRHVFDGAFVARMTPDHPKRIWLRAGRARLPIVKVFLPIAEDMEAALPEYERPAERLFAQRLEHELQRLMQAAG